MSIKKKILLIVQLIVLLGLSACGGDSITSTQKDIALDYIATYAQNGVAVPEVEDYTNAGVRGVTSDNISVLNDIILGLTYEDVDTTEEIQTILDEISNLAPIITLIGSDVTLEVGEVYNDAGATAEDTIDGNLTANIQTTSTVNTSIVGTYTVTYDVNDSSNNEATQVSRTVTIVDTNIPTITIIGSDVTIEAGSTYTDAGATATDSLDGDITANIQTISTVDTSTVGVYTVIYDVNDSSNNPATQVTRTVTVVDTTAANRTINVINNIEHNGTTYGFVISSQTGRVWLDRNLGASQVCTALDDSDCYGDYYQWGRNADGHEDNTSNTTSTLVNDVNNVGHGDFIINNTDWASVDSNGNIRSANWSKADGSSVCPIGFRLPTIGELEADTISNGITDINTAFTSFLKLPSAGFRSSDTIRRVSTEGFLWSLSYDDTESGYVGYKSSDIYSDLNIRQAGFSVRCIKDILDIVVPTITRTSNNKTIEAGSTYTDAGATAYDNIDGYITENIVTTSDVDTSTVGVYTVTYDVNDSLGNIATQVTRTVTVVDTTAPTITLNGDSTVIVGLNEDYDEDNATTSDNASGDLIFTLTGDVNTSTEGSYTLTYIVRDASGNESNVTRTVTVERFTRDDTDEMVTDHLTGRMWQDDEDAKTIEKNWQDSIDHCLAMDFGGYTDWVLPEIDVLSSLIDSSTVFNIVDEFSNMGAHFYWSATSDEHNNDAAQGVNFTFSGIISGSLKTATKHFRCVRDIVDITPPVITLNGDANISVIQHAVYVEQNATALDEKDDNVTDDIIIDNALVDTSIAGAYTVTYTVSDVGGNTAEANRTVNVIDNIAHNGTTYGFLISPHTGKVWLDRNLGASQMCTSSTDTDCYGDYYQWGRNADGHQDSTSNTNSTLVNDEDNLNNVGHGDFITSNAFADWASVDTDDAPIRSANWSKTDGSSVCPVGFRVPISAELESEIVNKGVQDFSNFLKLPFAGIRFFSDGSMLQENTTGIIWVNSPTGKNSSGISFSSSDDGATSGLQRAFGTSVRCMKD